MEKATVLSHLKRHLDAAKEEAKLTPEEIQRRGTPAHARPTLTVRGAAAREEAAALQAAYDHVARTFPPPGATFGVPHPDAVLAPPSAPPAVAPAPPADPPTASVIDLGAALKDANASSEPPAPPAEEPADAESAESAEPPAKPEDDKPRKGKRK